MTDFIEIEIDGKKIQAKPDQTVIQVADENGIYIPRFCYHKELSIPANCRMCLVDIEKSPKPMPACAMPVMPGMKVSTKSPKAVSAQRSVMEYLLINHPLDCPICDQGGECELQDLSLSYGASQSKYCEGKRAVPDPNIGPLVDTEMTRCIQCTRCVRFGDEIAGLRELGAVNRGEDLAITTYVQHTLHSELSGNIIDLCPVGALVAKPSRFKARPWELIQSPGVSPHDCVGSNVNIHSRNGEVIRVVSRQNADVNEMWIADRDRYAYEGLYHEDRVTQPMVRLDGKWEKADWMPTLDFAVGGLRRVMATSSSDHVGALISPNSTLEELYLLQKLMRGLGSSHIDHRLRQTDFRDQVEMPIIPGLGASYKELENADSVLLIGSNIQREQPLLGLRLRKAYLKGAAITAINMVDYKFNFRLKAKEIVAPHNLVSTLAGVVKALSDNSEKCLEHIVPDQKQREIARLLQQSKNGFVLLGALAFNHPEASTLRRLANLISEKTGVKLGFLTEGANTAGAWFAGAVPHRKTGGKVNTQVGLNAVSMLEKNRKGYLIFNFEPEFDSANPVLMREALKQADFVVAFSAFRSPVLEEVANVILPLAPFSENAGTFINAAGEWQSFKPAVTLYENAQPGWKILSSMANLFQMPGFRYETAESILQELKAQVTTETNAKAPVEWRNVVLPQHQPRFSRIGEVPMYVMDSLVRRSKPLQETQHIIDGQLALRLNPGAGFKEGEKILVRQKNAAVSLMVTLDKRIPEGAAFIASGLTETVGFEEMYGEVILDKGY